MAPYFRFNIPCAITTTTTTTTTTAPPCYCYIILAENGTTTISYSRCNDGATINLEVLSGNTAYVCSRDTPVYVSGAIPAISACTGTINCTSNVECIDCNGIPTTTSTTTTTTTAEPTTTTTTTTTSTTTTTTTAEPTTTTTTTTTSTTTTTTTIACFEYIATADQFDIDSSDNGTVFFDYVDCDGNPQTLGRGTTDPSNPVCARSVGSVYIIQFGFPSTVFSSFWSGPGDQCNEPPPPPPEFN